MNVVVIIADTWRFDYLGCYGNDWIKTPNIDRLASESMVFDKAYAEGCPTVPARRAMLTGRYTLPYRGWEPLHSSDVSIADMLWDQSIRTAFITDVSPLHLPGYGYERSFDFVHHLRGQEFDGFYKDFPCQIDPHKYHKPVYETRKGEKREILASELAFQELSEYLPQRQRWKGEEDQHVAEVARSAIHYLENVDRERPFLLWLDSFDPHEPWDPPSVWDEKLKCPYDPDYDGIEIINPVPTLVDDYLTEGEAKHIRALYAEKVTMVDRWLGKVIDRLKELDLYDDTMIVFVSDHGQPFGNNEHGHGIIRKCRPWPYEELVHVPLIFRVPGMDPGRSPAYVQHIDIAPTILDFLDVSFDDDRVQGRSLKPLIKREKDSIRDFAVCGFFGFSWSIINDEWSYIHWLEDRNQLDPQKIAAMYGWLPMEENPAIWTCTPGSKTETPRSNELYDRRKDPFQLENLLEKNEDTARALHDQLFNLMLKLKMNG